MYALIQWFFGPSIHSVAKTFLALIDVTTQGYYEHSVLLEAFIQSFSLLTIDFKHLFNLNYPISIQFKPD